MVTEKAYYFPWVRKGLSNRLTEVDTLGIMGDDTSLLAELRPVLSITTEYEMVPADHDDAKKGDVAETDDAAIPMSETREIQFISPGDITGINSPAILKVIPKEGSVGFSVQFYPYVEFWEPDFLWRYTPARPQKDDSPDESQDESQDEPQEKRLRPWLALLACRTDRCSVRKTPDGSYVTFAVEDDDQYHNIFPLPQDTWKTGHAQGLNPEEPNLSRLLALRAKGNLSPNTKYSVFLVPAFETGRRRGLGLSNTATDDNTAFVIAQAHGWEENLAEQKKKHPRPLDFPVYYSWTFESGEDSFDGLVAKLHIAGGFESDIKIDVTRMGEGLDYNDKTRARKTIGMPVAAKTLDYKTGKSFPDPLGTGDEEDERGIYSNLKELIAMNPVFAENFAEIYGSADGKAKIGDDDPWVVPPVYGAKHIMATSIEESANRATPWLTQLNLDIHNRAAAGLGKKTVQMHQEEFVNRAWKQVEYVQALNYELYRRLLSLNANAALKGKIFGAFDSNFIAGMMQNLGSMIDAMVKGEDGEPISLSSLLPGDVRSLATASFQHLTEDLAKQAADLNPATLMKNIAEKQIFRMKEHRLPNLPTIKQLRETAENIYLILLEEICKELSRYFFIEKRDILGASLEELYHLEPKGITFAVGHNYRVKKEGESYDSFFIYSTSWPQGTLRDEDFAYYGFLSGSEPRITDESESEQITSDSQLRYFGLPCILVLDDDKYIHLFGSGGKMVTKIGVEEPRYFIAKSRIKNLIDIRVPATGKKVGYFNAIISGKFTTMGTGSTRTTDSYVNMIVGANYDSETGALSPNWDEQTRVGNQWPRTSASGSVIEFPETYGHITPYYLILDVDAANRLGIIQELDSMKDYADFLKHNPEVGGGPIYLKEWVKLDTFVAQMEEEFIFLGRAKPPEESMDDDTVAELKQSIKDNSEAYEEMRAVAERYYREFFADTPEGRALRDKYIDDLLRSKYPIMAYPIFPEPVYYYLKMFSEKFILPCVDELPPDSVAVFESNPVFEEAYLCGMNTEMGRELLWREYPTDQRGSYFRKFWDSETGMADIHSENFFDIEPVHTWSGDLGANHPASKAEGLLLFTVKGKLMRQYPSTQIYLHRATGNLAARTLDFDDKATEANSGMILPLIQAFVKEDIFLVGFKGEFGKLVGNPAAGDYGYFLAFKEDVEDLNFQNDPDRKAGNEGADDLPENPDDNKADDAAKVAGELKNDPSLYGKHLSLFII